MTLTEALWPYLVIGIAGWLATDIWRFVGVALSARVEETGEVFIWVKAVATALVAGVIARLILFPAEPLAALPLALRLAAATLGFAAFWVARRNVVAGVLVTELVLIGGGWLLR